MCPGDESRPGTSRVNPSDITHHDEGVTDGSKFQVRRVRRDGQVPRMWRPMGRKELQDVQLGLLSALQGLRDRSDPMSRGVVHYRADGGDDYTFRFVWLAQRQAWRVYIERQPPYRGRNAGAHASHRLGLPNQPYVCWTDPLRNYEQAKAVAALWADATQRYIATGTFAPRPGSRNVTDRSTHASRSEQQLRAALNEHPSNAAPPTGPASSSSGPSGPIRRLLERIG